MDRLACRFGILLFAFFMAAIAIHVTAPRVEASCGSVTCFVVIGSQQQVNSVGLLTVNAIYNYTRQGTLLPGTNGVIPAVDVDTRQLILDHHRELRTITQTYSLDFNYGLTERLGLELMMPYVRRRHQHVDGLGEVNGGAGQETSFSDNGIGDVFVNLKYNVLPTLRSMVVTSFGAYLPTGDWRQKTAGASGDAETMEPTAQLGRGQVGLQGGFYQTYELIPHRLNQFASGTYRHTFRNNFGYQFGDQYDLNAGFSLVTVPWLVLTNQFNYRYMSHDSFSGSLARSQNPNDPTFPDEAIVLDPNITNRAVPTTGSTYFAYSPGALISIGERTQVYFFAQIPVVRDFNNNLAQGISFVFGITQYFQGPALFKG
ncbi:MAG: hypothetical protein ABI945_09945 [Nitrospirales bacterium]